MATTTTTSPQGEAALRDEAEFLLQKAAKVETEARELQMRANELYRVASDLRHLGAIKLAQAEGR